MEEAKALQKLIEAGDLVRMVEDLLKPGVLEKLSASSLSGVRITLKSVREGIILSHDALASDLVVRAKTGAESVNIEQAAYLSTESDSGLSLSGSQSGQLTRGDLRAALEKVVDR